MAASTQTIISNQKAEQLRTAAIGLALDWGRISPRGHGSDLMRHWRAVSDSLHEAMNRVRPGCGLILEHRRMLRTVLRESKDAVVSSRDLPHVPIASQGSWPRAFAIAAAYLEEVDYQFEEADFLAYLEGVPVEQHLYMSEIWALEPMLQFAALAAIARWA